MILLLENTNGQQRWEFKKNEHYESYVILIDMNYDADDTISTGYISELNTPEFKKVNMSDNRKGTEFKQDIVEFVGNICYVPTSRSCFVNCIKHLTGRNYKQMVFDYVTDEKRRSIVMTKARIQPFRFADNSNIGSVIDKKCTPDLWKKEIKQYYHIKIFFV